MTTSPSTHLFWIYQPRCRHTALVLSSGAVGFGLVMGGKLLTGRGPDRRSIHEILSLSVMVAIAMHGLTLIGDKFLHQACWTSPCRSCPCTRRFGRRSGSSLVRG